ncbi:MAG: ATP-binding cassette domain-containing protein [Phycisphaerales bacterium]|nr:MAG: ATP-binding cassette domain-containing protein [Phycisphaerales bacterium]
MARYAVRFENVSKQFRRGQIHDSLADWIGAGWGRVQGRGRVGPAQAFWALKDVSFEAAPGEALGIIGPNGAGKSTSLKLLAGILRPDGGQVHVNGRLGALIEVSAGLHGDLTGRENIFLSGAIMGMGRREIDRKLEGIVEFSGLEDFLDTPVKRYSTGMTARLGFSVAAHIDPDVLLVDEVLSVGDVAFRQRCEARMRQLVDGGTTLVFVTHNLEQMRGVCHRTIVLDQGKVTFVGDPGQASERYLRAMMQAGERSYSDCPPGEQMAGEVRDVRFINAAGCDTGIVQADEPATIEITFCLKSAIRRLSVEVSTRRLSGELFVNFNSARQGRWYDAPAGVNRVRVHVPSLPYAGGNYVAFARLWDADRCRVVAESPARYPLVIDDRGQPTGVLALPGTWEPRCEPVPDRAIEAPAGVGV